MKKRWNLPASAPKFFVYTLGCLVLLVGLAVKIGNISLFTHRTGYQALLSDASGLTPGNDVKIAGVTVGQVKSITTQHGDALVKFAVNNNVKLPASTQTEVRWANVIGEKYLYLVPNGTGGGYLAADAVIPANHELADADINAFLNALGPVLHAIDPQQANAFVEGVVTALQGNEGEVGNLINNAATVSQTVGNLNVEVGQVIDNLSTVMSALGSRSGDLENVVSNLATVSSALASRNGTLDSVVGNFAQLSTEFAQLLSTNRTSLDTAISSLQTVANTVAVNKDNFDKSLSTLSSGLAPYTLISSYGQWFNVQGVYTCLADEQNCQYGGEGTPNGQTQPNGAPSSSAQSTQGTPAPSASTTGSALSGLMRAVAGGAG